MDINNNDFFDEIKNNEFEDMDISNSGINYGDSINKFSLKTIIIAIVSGIVVAGISIMLFTPTKKTVQPTNFADIPTIPAPQEPIKIVPEDTKLNEVFENASIYTPTNFNTEASTITKQIVKPDVKEEFPIIRPTFVPEPKEIVENTAQKEEKTDIIKEANTDVVIITREYKMKSPDKYSFK